MGSNESKIGDSKFEGTGYSYTMSLIQGKHKMVILYCLIEFQPVRFNEMRRYLGKVTDKTLSMNLKELGPMASSSARSTRKCRPEWSTRSHPWAIRSWRCSTSCAPGARHI